MWLHLARSPTAEISRQKRVSEPVPARPRCWPLTTSGGWCGGRSKRRGAGRGCQVSILHTAPAFLLQPGSRPARMNREAHYWVITTIPSPRLIPADHGRNPELPLFTCNCLQHNPHLRITRFSPFMKGCSSQEGYLDFEPPPHFLHSCIPETHMKLISATLPDRGMWKVLIIDDFLVLMRSRTERVYFQLLYKGLMKIIPSNVVNVSEIYLILEFIRLWLPVERPSKQ
ncbi:uncharacterized protein LOC108585468 isoform X1 [Papio anubis]|uniref:uncharacterized protein LOC108585468 isoform X1 n=1 Tax=Papio anubis TaxID=9555 RepID=UPI0012AE8082|nr:uncharacterized protein LOC108585468 isoform X1 [Papio anubis]